MGSWTAKAFRSPGLWPALLVGLALTYGSTYPFRFVFPPPEGAWEAFLSFRSVDLYFGNTLANLLLFVPLGFLVALGCRSRVRGLVWAVAAGLALGAGLQAAQVFLPDRVPSLWDATWNVAGSVLGGLFPRTPLRRLAQFARPRSAFAAALLGLWLAAETFPFVPTLDWQTLKDALKPLLLHPELDPIPLGANLVGWAALAHLWASRVRLPLARIGPILALLAVLAIQVLVVHRAPTLSGALGGAAGVFLGLLPVSPHAKSRGLLVLLVVWLAASGLSPWAFRQEPGSFHWLPLAGFLRTGTLHALHVGIEKLFWYGLLVELLASERRLRPVTIAALGAAFLGGIEWGQRWVAGGHVAEVTDPLILAGLALARAGWSAGLPFPAQALPDQVGGQQAQRHPQGVGAEVENPLGRTG